MTYGITCTSIMNYGGIDDNLLDTAIRVTLEP